MPPKSKKRLTKRKAKSAADLYDMSGPEYFDLHKAELEAKANSDNSPGCTPDVRVDWEMEWRITPFRKPKRKRLY